MQFYGRLQKPTFDVSCEIKVIDLHSVFQREVMDPGDFRRIFRQMFGIPDDYRHHRRGDFESESLDRFNRGDEESAQGRQEQFHLDENHRGRHFSVLTDPLEIHRYFEQQMDEMLKNFGFGFGGFGTLSEPREERGYGPMVLTPDDDPPSTNPRDFMLNDYGGRGDTLNPKLFVYNRIESPGKHISFVCSCRRASCARGK